MFKMAYQSLLFWNHPWHQKHKVGVRDTEIHPHPSYLLGLCGAKDMQGLKSTMPTLHPPKTYSHSQMGSAVSCSQGHHPFCPALDPRAVSVTQTRVHGSELWTAPKHKIILPVIIKKKKNRKWSILPREALAEQKPVWGRQEEAGAKPHVAAAR